MIIPWIHIHNIFLLSTIFLIFSCFLVTVHRYLKNSPVQYRGVTRVRTVTNGYPITEKNHRIGSVASPESIFIILYGNWIRPSPAPHSLSSALIFHTSFYQISKQFIHFRRRFQKSLRMPLNGHDLTIPALDGLNRSIRSQC